MVGALRNTIAGYARGDRGFAAVHKIEATEHYRRSQREVVNAPQPEIPYLVYPRTKKVLAQSSCIWRRWSKFECNSL